MTSFEAFGSRPGKAFSPIGIAVHHGERVADEAPAAEQARAEIVFAGEEGALHVGALEEQAIDVALADLEAERES